MTISKPARVLLAASAAATALVLASCATPPEDVTIPGDVVEPGTTVAVGETVRVPGRAVVGESIGDVEVGLTVVSITYEDTSFFNTFDNASEFDGYEPVVVKYQVDRADEGTSRPEVYGPYGVLDETEYSMFVTSENSLGNASVADTTDLCWGGGISFHDDDKTTLGCMVLLVPFGQELTSVEWDAQSANPMREPQEGDPDYGFYVEPLIFELPAK